MRFGKGRQKDERVRAQERGKIPFQFLGRRLSFLLLRVLLQLRERLNRRLITQAEILVQQAEPSGLVFQESAAHLGPAAARAQQIEFILA